MKHFYRFVNKSKQNLLLVFALGVLFFAFVLLSILQLPVEMTVSTSSNDPSYIQVYFFTNNGYSENESIRHKQTASIDKNIFKFPVPTSTLEKVRIDPSDTASSVTINEIVFKSPFETKELAGPILETLIVGKNDVTFNQLSNALNVSSGANDPYFEISFPRTMFKMSFLYKLLISIAISLLAVVLLYCLRFILSLKIKSWVFAVNKSPQLKRSSSFQSCLSFLNIETDRYYYLLLGICIILAGIWFTYSFHGGERIQHNDGLGWDGVLYAELAQKDPVEIFKDKKLDDYYVSRTLVPILVHYASDFVGYPLVNADKSNGNVIKAYFIFNCILLALSLIFWALITRKFNWTKPVRLLSFFTVFCIYPILKYSTYNPTLTDISGFTVGMITLYLFITDKTVLLAFTILVGSFVWPSILYTTLPLLIFRFKNLTVNEYQPNSFSNYISLFFSIFAVGATLYVYNIKGNYFTLTTPVNEHVLPATALLLLGYIFFCCRQFIDPVFLAEELKSTKFVLRLGVATLIYVFAKGIVNYYSSGATGPFTIITYIMWVGQSGIKNPLVNIVGHTMYFGPLYLFMVFHWKEIVHTAKSMGLGLLIYISLYALLSINPESRQHFAAWPFFAMLGCETLNRMKISWRFTFSILIISLILSRFWLEINRAPWTGDFMRFPDQMLYMGSGTWMSNTMYAVFLGVTILTALAINTSLETYKKETQ